MRGLNVETATWREVDERLSNSTVAILPIGAAAKEHGAHLPMNTDQVQAQWLVQRLLDLSPVVTWPVFSYGYYPVFVDYPGSISIAANTFSRAVGDVINGIERAGARKIVLLNTGISTIAPLQHALAQHVGRARCNLLNVYDGANFRRACDRICEQAFGGHADEVETSIMLAIDASLVNMARAKPAPKAIARGIFNRTDPDAKNYSSDGVNGDPTLATREKGEMFLQALLDDVLEAVTSVASA